MEGRKKHKGRKEVRGGENKKREECMSDKNRIQRKNKQQQTYWPL